MDALRSVFSKNKDVEGVILFGSRAKGTFKEGSDIDIALIGDKLNMTSLRKIELELDELSLPYHLDVVIYKNIKEQALKEHIDRVGVRIG
ncbi:Nucleotidyltransferase domain-containing protein [Thermophagus xiamenensis]|uniref:Nucleotidyltransferase domain-containing protein n=2 Tax=Thermophagus xiamenensis TaxID=385682 RepID=A0A1I2DP83_9BACT|nr:Nucleotidyltransferase domain-containing protein [Thermophagus xiamenensis]